MPAHDVDLFVIGGGSGGVRAARIAAEHGARVAIAEEYRYGGTCVIRGCVPKKLLVYAAEFRDAFADAGAYGWQAGEPTFDWATLIRNKDAEIDRLEGIYRRLLETCGARIVEGRAVLADPHTVEVGGRRVTAGTILVATGAHPYVPHGPGSDHFITSDDAFHLPALPPRVAVIGGGYIAVEFAHIFRGLGSEVTLIHRRAEVLRGFDHDLAQVVTRQLGERGVRLCMETEVIRVERGDAGLTLTLQDGSTLACDAAMAATGRVPNTRGLGLEEAGVELTLAGAICVDEYSRTRVPHIYAVGDCTDRVNLTPIAIREGQAFADTVFGDRPTAIDHAHVPTAVFSQPAAAAIGLTEAEARAGGGEVHIYKAMFRPMKHSLTGRNERVLMKLVVDGASQRVLGAHMVGHDAPEVIQCVAIAVRMGATKADFDATVAIHPTTAEELVLMKTRSHSHD
jgi:glutathione reductase (NADPH)